MILAGLLGIAFSSADAAPVNRFDVVTLCCDCPIESHLCEPQFDTLNWPDAQGHYLAMGSDAHRAQVVARGNRLAVYYDVFNDGYGSMTAGEKAAAVEHYAQTRFTATGPRPNWLIANEISAGQWPTNAAYRKWAVEVVSALKEKYKFSIVLCAPFQRPGAHAEDWQAIAANATIGIECYLSGKAIRDHGFSTHWCESQYRVSKEKYRNLGVPARRLFLVEDFANTEDAPDRTWGRQGVSPEDWDKAITVRSAALHNAGFAGFISYGWSQDRMKVPDAELVRFEKTYTAQVLP
jgi:hypothetical protein